MQPTFHDPELQARFERDGFVTLPLLSAGEVAELDQFYQNLPMEAQSGFHASMFQPSRELKVAADEKIRAVAAQKVLDQLNGFRDLYANFMVKEPGPESEMKVHQDWTYVEEPRLHSLAVWFPLMDLDHQKGCLYFLRGGHRLPMPVRGPGIKDPYEKVAGKLVEDFLTAVPLKAGEAVIWRHELPHWSPPNLSEQTRIAGTIIFVPEAAEVVHFYRKPELPFDQAEKFRVERDFFMDYNIMAGPEKAEKAGLIQTDIPYFSEKDLKNLGEAEEVSAQSKPQEPVPAGIFSRLRRFFQH